VKAILMVGLLTIAITAGPVAAFWDHQSSSQDVFGNTNVTATSVGDNGGLLRIECGSNIEGVRAAYLMKSGGKELASEFPGRFIIKTAGGSIVKAEATLREWNENYWAMVTTDQNLIRALAQHMKVAVKSIPIGIETSVFGLQVSDTFSSRGSTAASITVIKGCLGPAPTVQAITEARKAPKDDTTLYGTATVVGDPDGQVPSAVAQPMDKLIAFAEGATHYEVNGKGVMLYENAPASFYDEVRDVSGMKSITAKSFIAMYCEQFDLKPMFEAGYTLNIFVRKQGAKYLRLGGHRKCYTTDDILDAMEAHARNQ
jgi:hypothetical protein